jgi:hypothetical protein
MSNKGRFSMQNRLLKLIRFVDGAEPVLQYLLFHNYKIRENLFTIYFKTDLMTNECIK